MPEHGGATNVTVVVGCLVVCLAASAGAGVALAAGSDVAIQGGLVAVAAFALAGAVRRAFAGAYPISEDREEREAPPDPAEHAPIAPPGGGWSRRGLLGLVAGIGGLFFAALLAPLRTLVRAPADARATAWERGVPLVDPDGERLTPAAIPAGGLATAWPGRGPRIEADAVLVLRVPGTAGALEDLVAFSKLCTHAGCGVGILRAEAGVLYCPCHQAEFDATTDAAPVAGPATRRLPRLPLAVDGDGHLVADGGFDGPVGAPEGRRQS